MTIKDKITGLVHRNSDKNLNNTTTTTTAAPLATNTAVAGRSYELPAEPVIAAVAPTGNLAGRSYELPAQETTLLQQTNPLDRNGDGILDLNQTGFSNVAGNRLSQGIVRAEPTVLETIQKDVVVHERIHPVEKEEIQPIIYREREQLDVKQVTQMLHETQIQPTLVQQRELAAEVRAPIVERGAPIPENVILPTREIDATLRTQQIHAPIVEETIRKTVIEEIQPVLERDVFAPTIVQNTQPIYEKIVEAPTVYREVRDMRELGTREIIETAPLVAAPILVEQPVVAPLQVVPITTTTTVETYDHKLNPIETRDFINNRGLPLR